MRPSVRLSVMLLFCFWLGSNSKRRAERGVAAYWRHAAARTAIRSVSDKGRSSLLPPRGFAAGIRSASGENSNGRLLPSSHVAACGRREGRQ